MTTPPVQRTERLRGAIALFTMAAFAVPVAYSLHGGIPYNPIKLPGEDKAGTMAWGPQGWKFFTREPQEEQPVAYALTADGAWRLALKWPNARLDNLLGLSREGRAQGIEMGVLLQNLPKSAWKTCDEAPFRCLDASARLDVKNTSPHPSLCGTVGVVLQPPVPFAWRESGEKVIMPSHVTKLEVKC